MQMEAALPDAHGTTRAAAAFSEDTTPGDSPRSGDSAESTSFRCAICLVRRCPAPHSAAPASRKSTAACVEAQSSGGILLIVRSVPLLRRAIQRHQRHCTTAGADVDAGGPELRPHLLCGVRVPGRGRARLDPPPGPGAPTRVPTAEICLC